MKASMGPKQFLFIVGAPKAGTTSLATWLGLNEHFFAPSLKEPGFFRDRQDYYVLNTRGDRGTTTINFDKQKYLALYESAGPTQWGIDASTDYLSCEQTADRIMAFSQSIRVKVMCILRDPVDRAFSEYRHTVRDGLETETFRRSIELEPQRIREKFQPLFFHVRRSQYYADINRYIELFGEDLLLLDYKLLQTPSEILRRVSELIGVTVSIPESLPVLNESISQAHPLVSSIRSLPLLRSAARTVMGSRLRAKLGNWLETSFRRSRVQLSEADRMFLIAKLQDDINACVEHPAIPTDSWATSSVE